MTVERTINTFNVARRIRRCHGFATEHTAHAHAPSARAAVVLSQAVAQLSQQRIMCDLCQIGDINRMSELLAASGTHRDEGHRASRRPGRQCRFGPYLIASIDDGRGQTVKARYGVEQGRPVVGSHEVIDHVDNTTRVKKRNALAHCLGLGLAEGRLHGMDLPVDIGFGHVVKIDQREAPNTAARQGFNRPGPDSTDAHHHHMRIENALRSVDAIESTQTAKAALEGFAGVVRHSRSSSQI